MIKRLLVLIMCFSSIFSFFTNFKNKHILDGPGMENTFVWDSFSVSRSGDNYAQHNFAITVKYHEDGYVVTGSVIGHDEDEGIILPKSACRKIDELQPHKLPDIYQYPPNSSEEETDEEIIILDASDVSVEVTYVNGTQVSKVDENDFSLSVFEIVYPYFEEKMR